MFSRKLGALALVAGLFAASASQAAVYDLGTLAAGLNGPAINGVSGSFSDTYNFSLSSASEVSGGVAALNLAFGPYKVLNIDALNVSLFNSANVALGSGTSFSLSNVAAGSYHAVVSGLANGLSGGTYGIAINVSPVPEPSTYAMLGVGLAAVGFMARRKKAA